VAGETVRSSAVMCTSRISETLATGERSTSVLGFLAGTDASWVGLIQEYLGKPGNYLGVIGDYYTRSDVGREGECLQAGSIS
jgi:hypothetical protein